MIAAHNALAAMTTAPKVAWEGIAAVPVVTFRSAQPYQMPRGVNNVRAFDDPTVAVEAHHRMEVRFNDDANASQYEG